MKRGDIYLGRFPMAGKGGVKLRPVLMLTDPVGPVPEVLAAYISGSIPPSLLPSDILLDASQPEFASTNLAQISVLRLHKLSTLHQRDFVRRLGELSPAVMKQVEALLRTLLKL